MIPEADLSTATAVLTHYGWLDVVTMDANTVTVSGDFNDFRIPKTIILEVRK